MKQFLAVILFIPTLLFAADLAETKIQAEKGDVVAQTQLGDAYKGLGDCVSALAWYRKAAEQNYVDAEWRLSQMLLRGCSGTKTNKVDVNAEEAVLWLLKLAEAKRLEAMAQLALCYEKGKGVPQDRIEAYKWYRLIDQIDRHSDKGPLNALILTLSKAEIEEGDKRLKEYQAAHTPRIPLQLRLKLISGTGSQAVALINNQTFKAGETGPVKAGNEKVTIRCVEIQGDHVIVEVAGAKKTIRLGADLEIFP